MPIKSTLAQQSGNDFSQRPSVVLDVLWSFFSPSTEPPGDLEQPNNDQKSFPCPVVGTQQSPPTAAAVTMAPAILSPLISLDSSLSHRIHSLTKTFVPQSFLLLLELTADFRFFFPATLSLFLAISPSSPLRFHLLSPLIICSLLDLLFIGLVKSLVRRSRPLYNTHSKYNAVVSVDNFSFPSGHSSRVCFIAALVSLSRNVILDAVIDLKARGRGGALLVIDRWFGGEEANAVNFLVLLVWVWASVTSLSRVLLGRHFVLDVFAGASLGVLEALFTFHFLRF